MTINFTFRKNKYKYDFLSNSIMSIFVWLFQMFIFNGSILIKNDQFFKKRKIVME